MICATGSSATKALSDDLGGRWRRSGTRPAAAERPEADVVPAPAGRVIPPESGSRWTRVRPANGGVFWAAEWAGLAVSEVPPPKGPEPPAA